MLREIWKHWATHWLESLLALLFIVGGTVPLLLPIAIWIRIALVPVGWLAAFGVWAAIIAVICWFAAPPRTPES